MWNLICDRTARRPDVLTLTDGKRRVSYTELTGAALPIARSLRSAGVRPGDTVGLCSVRSMDQVQSLLGILAAGAAAAPFDVRQAGEAVRGSVARLAPAAVLADAEGRVLCPGALRFEDLVPDPAPESQVPPVPPMPGAGDPAYVIHTSGSSGRPEPVQVPHGHGRPPLAPGEESGRRDG